MLDEKERPEKEPEDRHERVGVSRVAGWLLKRLVPLLPRLCRKTTARQPKHTSTNNHVSRNKTARQPSKPAPHPKTIQTTFRCVCVFLPFQTFPLPTPQSRAKRDKILRTKITSNKQQQAPGANTRRRTTHARTISFIHLTHGGPLQKRPRLIVSVSIIPSSYIKKKVPKNFPGIFFSAPASQTLGW